MLNQELDSFNSYSVIILIVNIHVNLILIITYQIKNNLLEIINIKH